PHVEAANEMGRNADLAELYENVLGNAVVEHPLAVNQRMLLVVEGGGVILEVLDEGTGLRTLVQHLGLALIDPTAPVHLWWTSDCDTFTCCSGEDGTIPIRARAVRKCSAPTPRRGGAMGPEPDERSRRTLAERGARNNLNGRASCRVANPTQREIDLAFASDYASVVRRP